MSTPGWIILAVVNLPVYFVLGRLFFSDWDEFWEALRFWITPDLISALRGEFWDDWWAETKLGLWFVCCAGCVLAEAYSIGRILG